MASGTSPGQRLRDFAQAKLLRMPGINYKNAKKIMQRPNAILAVLGSRLILEFEPSHQSTRQTVNELVASHMRLAYSVPAREGYMVTGYSSEPLLAEAAANTLFLINQVHEGNMPLDKLLAEFVANHLLQKGTRSALAGSAILTKAYDKAREKEFAEASPGTSLKLCPPVYGEAVLLVNFIKALFGPNTEIILKSRPDNVLDGQTFEEAFKDARVRFTHWAKAGDDTAISTAACFAAAVRGMAWQCREHQGIVDCLIPIILWDGLLGESIMSAILIQFKDRAREACAVDMVIDAAALNFFPENAADKRPYITLLMDLGVQTQTPEECTHRQKVNLGSKAPASPKTFVAGPPTRARVTMAPVRTRSSKRLPADQHPRYAIRATGCSPAVYGAVESKALYAKLLGSRDFLREHPHGNSASLGAVRRMKPFWTMGKHSYHWIDHNILQGRPEDDDPEVVEGVTVGAEAIAPFTPGATEAAAGFDAGSSSSGSASEMGNVEKGNPFL